ncbi:MAG TPA: ABC transporter permease, partial [Terriglobia bacterium]|nr:ABC transporter permease [Terriglobia bacterium]
MHQLLQNLKFGLRILGKSPGVTAIILLSLALGIGTNATVLCWIQKILWDPIPGAVHPEQIVGLVSNQGGGNTSLPDIRDLGALEAVFAGAVASQISPASLTFDEQTDWVYGQVATANLFELLGVKPLLGRTFLPDEDLKPGGNPVLVISETLWRRRFAGDPNVLGQVVKINRLPYTIIGVTPRIFKGTMTGLGCDFWAPISMYDQVGGRADDIRYRNNRGFHNFAMLRPGVTIEQAQAAVSLLDTQLAATYPDTNREVHHRVVPYSKVPYGAQQILGPALRILLAVSLGVLLIVVANVANLLLARAISRQKEIAIRLSAGASRWQLVRQMLTESIFLSLLGGAGGILVASWGVSLIGRFLPVTNLPVSIFGYQLDATTLGMTMVVTLSTGILFGIVPALKTSQLRLSSILKESGRTAAGSTSHHHWRQALVVTEVALSLVLLVSAGLCYKGLKKAQSIQIGFKTDHVLTAGLPLAMSGYKESNGREFYQQLLQRLAITPGVEEATYASWLPLGLGGCKGHGVDAEGYIRKPGENPTYEYAIVAPRYFTTLRIPLVAGRDFTDLDRNDTQKVAIVNEAFAARFWPGQNALGRRFRAAGRIWT